VSPLQGPVTPSKLGSLARSLVAVAALGLCTGCDRSGGQQAPATPVERRAPAELEQLKQRVKIERHALERRLLGQRERAGKRRELSCPDSALGGLDEAGRALLLRSEDLRLDRRHLLPLSMTAALESPELVGFRRRTEPGDELGAPLASLTAAEHELANLKALGQRRFQGVYEVTEYVSPKRIHKPNRVRAEWTPGWLVAWLVVYDLESDKEICQSLLRVRNDVSEAPLGVRLKSEVRDRLIVELGKLLRSESARALGRISRVLVLPAT
jgi:hypothetical protein